MKQVTKGLAPVMDFFVIVGICVVIVCGGLWMLKERPVSVPELVDFASQSECHDGLARDLIREKGEFTKKDAGDVSDICATQAAGEELLRQLDAAAENKN